MTGKYRWVFIIGVMISSGMFMLNRSGTSGEGTRLDADRSAYRSVPIYGNMTSQEDEAYMASYFTMMGDLIEYVQSS